MLNLLPMFRVHQWYAEQVPWRITVYCEDRGETWIELSGEAFVSFEDPYIYHGSSFQEAMDVLTKYVENRSLRLGYLDHTTSTIGLLRVDFCPIYLPRNWIFV